LFYINQWYMNIRNAVGTFTNVSLCYINQWYMNIRNGVGTFSNASLFCYINVSV